ncbi:unnamed protein product, partial [Linum tenue]
MGITFSEVERAQRLRDFEVVALSEKKPTRRKLDSCSGEHRTFLLLDLVGSNIELYKGCIVGGTKKFVLSCQSWRHRHTEIAWPPPANRSSFWVRAALFVVMGSNLNFQE